MPPEPNPEAVTQPTVVMPDISANLQSAIVQPYTYSLADDAPKKLKPGLWWLIIGLVVTLISALGALAYYEAYVVPKQALASYLIKVSQSKTGLFNSTVSWNDGSSKLDIALDGSYDIQDLNNPKFDVKFDGKMGDNSSLGTLTRLSSTVAAQSIKGELLTTEKTLYAKLESLGLYTSFIPTKYYNTWYKYPIGSQTSLANKCLTTKKSGSSSLLGNQILTQFPLKNIKRIGLFETIDRHQTTHYQAAVDFGGLQSAVDSANKSLPADCKITLQAHDFKDLSIKYDLWTSKAFDRFAVHIASTASSDKTTTEISVDTSSYDNAVNITTPAEAKLFDYANFNGYYDSSSDYGTSTNKKDAQRKSDLRAVKNALETYYNDINSYPVAASYNALSSTLVNSYLPSLPQDPTNSGTYVYSYTPLTSAGGKVCKKQPCAAYALTAHLINTADTEIKIGTKDIYELLSVN